MSSGGGSQKVTQETKATPWAGVQPYLTSMYGMAGSQMASPMNFYPGNTTAPMSPLTGEGQGELYGFARGVMPEYLQTGDEGLRAMFGAADVANNPYVNQMLDAQARNVGDQLTRQWLPGIRQGASLAGQTGSSRQGVAEGVAIGDAAKALADATAQTQMNAYSQGLQQRTSAMAALPQMAQLGMLPGQTMQGLGQQQEQYLQNQIDEAIRRFDYYQAEPWQRLNYANAIYSGIPWNTQTQSSGGGGSSAANTLGSAMMLGSLGKGLFSSLPMAAAQQAFAPWTPAAGWGAMGSTPFAQAGAAMGMQSPAAFLSGTAAAAPALAGLGTAGAGLSLGGMESLLAFAPLLI